MSKITTLIFFFLQLNLQNCNSAINPDLKNQYDIMLKSASYIDYEGAANSFLSKMNFHDDFDILDNEERLFEWISKNITVTQYSSIELARAAWMDVKQKYQTSRTANEAFYIALKSSRMYDFVDILAPDNYTSNNNCITNL